MLICKIIQEIKDGVKVYGFTFLDKTSGKTVYSVRDVFTDRVAAEALRDAVNESDICKEHISDIIEDAIGSF